MIEPPFTLRQFQNRQPKHKDDYLRQCFDKNSTMMLMTIGFKNGLPIELVDTVSHGTWHRRPSRLSGTELHFLGVLYETQHSGLETQHSKLSNNCRFDSLHRLQS